MADIVVEQGAQAAPAENNINPDLHQAMQTALGKQFVPDIPAQMEPSQPQPPATAPPAQQAPIATPQEPAQPTAPTDIFAPFREKFGYQSPEDALRDIEETRAKLADPFREISFANEESAAMAMALSKGEYDKVYDHLDRQRRLNGLVGMEVTKDTAADIVKYGLQIQYPFLSSEEINYEFNKQFAISPKPVQGADEDAQDYEARVSQWSEQANDKYMGLVIQAKKFKPELEKAKKDLIFPKIEQPVDDGYAQYQKMLEQITKEDQEAVSFYKTLTPKHLETKIGFTDEPNKINFEYRYEPDADSLARTINLVSNQDQFYALFKNPDGTPDRIKFAQVIDRGLNAEKYIMEAMKQAKNAAIKATLPDNSQPGMVRQMPQLAPGESNELDQQMKRALQGYM